MSTTYRYQEEFSAELTQAWLAGKQEHVRLTIRQLKNKAQAAYIAAMVAVNLANDQAFLADEFCDFMHPNY
ncbi:hypothetical protein [Zavarzinella formosa]|uniref:hypothetical protein n=1 Tax=Zavarzinella formosa TaxID=360055 RepID=UPI0003184A48|nr:hypothetical protein [Zavarzinella formosa]